VDFNNAVHRAHLGDLTGLNFAALVRLSFELDPEKLEDIKARVIADLEVNNREVQEQDCNTYIRSRGGTLVHVYDEPDTSAWKKRKVKLPDGSYGYRVVRPIYEGVLEDLKRGLTPTGKRLDGLVVADFDRLTRDQRHLEDAIDVVTQYGRPIIDITGTLDLLTDNGRDMARILVTIKSRQSVDSSRRVRRKHQAMAERGLIMAGPRPFGWNSDRRTLHPVEAPILRQAVDDLLAGVNPTRIIRRWNEQGVKTARGNMWERPAFVQLLTNPRLAGWRVYQGKIATDKDGKQLQADIEALIDHETWLQVCTILAPKTQRQDPRRRRVYLLSGILRCGRCGNKLYGSKGNAYACGYYYYCVNVMNPGRCQGVFGAGKAIDDLVTYLALAHLGEHKLEVEDEPWPESETLERVAQQISEVMTAYRAGELSAAIAFPNVTALEEEKAQLQILKG